MQVSGRIHHITAIVGDPQENLDFYRGVLGMRLIKQTVNFDRSSTYHFYYGDRRASPGFVLTFFPYPDGRKGELGGGQVGRIVFYIPQGTSQAWQERLHQHGVPWQKDEVFDQEAIFFSDPHGLDLAFLEAEETAETIALLGFAGVILHSTAPRETLATLEAQLGLKQIRSSSENYLLQTVGEAGHFIELPKETLPLGRIAVGTVHHIAWSMPDEASHQEAHDYFNQVQENVTEIKDRKYFKAFYFREAGQILFEVASDTPGFTVDESLADLGESLQLPDQYESRRAEFQATLPEIELKDFQEI